jgi:hypothetical protein
MTTFFKASFKVLIVAVSAIAISWTVSSLTNYPVGTRGNLADFEQALISNYKSFAYLKTNFPTEYSKVLESSFNAMESDASKHLENTIAFESVAAFRRSHAKYLAFAPYDAIKKFSLAQRDFFAGIKARQGDVKCAEFVERGISAFQSGEEFMLKVGDLSDEASLRMFVAMKLGLVKPQETLPSKDDDWLVVFEGSTLSAVRSEYFLSLLAQEKYDDPEFCAAFINFWDTISEADGPESHRLRVQSLIEMAAT